MPWTFHYIILVESEVLVWYRLSREPHAGPTLYHYGADRTILRIRVKLQVFKWGPMSLLLLPCNHCSIGHGLLKKYWPLVLGCVLRTAGSSIIWNYADPLTSLELLNVIGCVIRTAVGRFWNYADPLSSLELLNYYLTLAMSSGRYCI